MAPMSGQVACSLAVDSSVWRIRLDIARQVWKALELVGYFAVQAILAAARVAWDVVTPSVYAKPGVIAIPLDVRSDTGITVLAALVTLTPGTLALDVSEDRRVLYIHRMFISDPDRHRRKIKSTMERRVMELFS